MVDALPSYDIYIYNMRRCFPFSQAHIITYNVISNIHTHTHIPRSRGSTQHEAVWALRRQRRRRRRLKRARTQRKWHGSRLEVHAIMNAHARFSRCPLPTIAFNMPSHKINNAHTLTHLHTHSHISARTHSAEQTQQRSRSYTA